MHTLAATADTPHIDTDLDCRAVSFENVTGDRGAGGRAAHGRKGAPSRTIGANERVVLADIAGTGTIRHLWLTVTLAPPEQLRALVLEVFYGANEQPSISVPVVDFFGVAHGRPVAYQSLLTGIAEGRGFNSYLQMPFREGVRVEFVNAGAAPVMLYFQIDYTLQPGLDDRAGYLHATFHRENPTTPRRDFVISDGLRGPGRFLGCTVGLRILDEGAWYGEGEVKMFRDGDAELPTICGTGLEDYVGTAWGLGPHAGLYAGAPLVVSRDTNAQGMDMLSASQPDFVSLYRWHVLDPIVFERELRVTIQQIGFAAFPLDDPSAREHYERSHPTAGEGWMELPAVGVTGGLAERVDDYCAVDYVYCAEPQAVPRVDVAAAIADIERMDYEEASPFEILGTLVATLDAPA